MLFWLILALVTFKSNLNDFKWRKTYKNYPKSLKTNFLKKEKKTNNFLSYPILYLLDQPDLSSPTRFRIKDRKLFQVAPVKGPRVGGVQLVDWCFCGPTRRALKTRICLKLIFFNNKNNGAYNRIGGQIWCLPCVGFLVPASIICNLVVPNIELKKCF